MKYLLIFLAWAFFYYDPTAKTYRLTQSQSYPSIEECEENRSALAAEFNTKPGYWISPQCFERRNNGKS